MTDYKFACIHSSSSPINTTKESQNDTKTRNPFLRGNSTGYFHLWRSRINQANYCTKLAENTTNPTHPTASARLEPAKTPAVPQLPRVSRQAQCRTHDRINQASIPQGPPATHATEQSHLSTRGGIMENAFILAVYTTGILLFCMAGAFICEKWGDG